MNERPATRGNHGGGFRSPMGKLVELFDVPAIVPVDDDMQARFCRPADHSQAADDLAVWSYLFAGEHERRPGDLEADHIAVTVREVLEEIGGGKYADRLCGRRAVATVVAIVDNTEVPEGELTPDEIFRRAYKIRMARLKTMAEKPAIPRKRRKRVATVI